MAIFEKRRPLFFYGDTVNAICAYLYGEGVISIDRIEDFINALSGNILEISAGTVYHFCSRFASACSGLTGMLEQKLLNAHEICTDATPVTNNGRMNYIRNFSTQEVVLCCFAGKKDLDTLSGFPILSKFSGIFCHTMKQRCIISERDMRNAMCIYVGTCEKIRKKPEIHGVIKWRVSLME